MALNAKTLRALEGIERARLQRLEARRSAKETREGIDETVALQEARGAEFTGKGRVRRMTGLEWLERQGRITDLQRDLGERYGAEYRTWAGEARMKSCLAESNPVSVDPSLYDITVAAHRRTLAWARLNTYRRQVGNVPGLVGALDAICGEEKTPREACRNGAEAKAMTELAVAALQLLESV